MSLVLIGFLDPFRSNLEPTWAQVGAQNCSELAPSWVQNGSQDVIQEQLAKIAEITSINGFSRFWGVGGPKVESKLAQNSAKNRLKNKTVNDMII